MPSSFALIVAAPMSSPGMPLPCIAKRHAHAAAEKGLRARRADDAPGQRRVPRVPVGRLPNAVPALRQAVGPDDALEARLPLAEVLGYGVAVALADGVRQAVLHRVAPERVRDLVHLRLDGEEALRGAVSAERARDGQVRVDRVAPEPEAVRTIERQALAAGVRRYGQSVRPVGAGVAEHVHLARERSCRRRRRRSSGE